MYSDRVLKCVSNAIKILSKSRIFPYTWDKKHKLIASHQSKHLSLFVLLHFSQVFFRSIYLVLRLYLGTVNGSLSPTDVAWILVFMIVNYVAFEVTSLPLLKHKEQVALFRNILRIDKKIESNCNGSLHSKAELFQFLLLKVNMYMAPAFSTMFSALYFVNPNSIQYINSVIADEGQTIYVALGILEINLIFIMVFGVLLLHAIFFSATAFLVVATMSFR